jgi:hypothetical protein
MKRAVFFIFIVVSLHQQIIGQQVDSGFSSLSSAEKWWVVCHPFKAKRALGVSLKTLEVTDSIKRSGLIGADNNGGQLDAFKHTYWMLLLSKDIGSKAALRLGNAHEKGNYRSFKNGSKEDGYLPDKVSSDMDLFNNQVGIDLYEHFPDESKQEHIDRVLNSLRKGELRMIKKEGSNFMNCQGLVIEPTALIGTWENEKCLIPTHKI